MQGAYSRPIERNTYLRPGPPMRRASLKDANKYLKNLPLEVAAAGAGTKIAAAVGTGLTQIGETLAKAEAETELLTHTTAFETEVNTQLSDLQSKPIAEEKVDWFHGNPESYLVGTGKDSLATVNKWFIDRRDQYAKRFSNKLARDAFLRQSATTVSGAQTKAAAISRKQRINFLQGALLAEIEKEWSYSRVDKLTESPLARLLFTGPQLNNYRVNRKRAIAVHEQSVAIVSAEDVDALEQLEESLEDGTDRQSIHFNPDNPKEAPIYDRIPGWEYLTGQDILNLQSKINSKIDRINKEEKIEKDTHFNDRVASLYRHPYDPDNSHSTWVEDVKNGKLDGKHLKGLEEHRNYAIQIQQTDRTVDYDTANQVLADIKNPNYTQAYILSLNLVESQERLLLTARKTYESGTPMWWESNNPDGIQGYYAAERLKRAFGYEPALLELVSGEKRAEITKEYSIARTQLEDKIMAWRADGKTNREVLALALEEANIVFNNRMGLNENADSAKSGTQTKAFPVQFKGEPHQYSVYEQWSKDNRAKDGSQLTYDYIINMPFGPQRDQYLNSLIGFGFEVPETEVGRTKVDDINDLIEERSIIQQIGDLKDRITDILPDWLR